MIKMDMRGFVASLLHEQPNLIVRLVEHDGQQAVSVESDVLDLIYFEDEDGMVQEIDQSRVGFEPMTDEYTSWCDAFEPFRTLVAY